MKKLIGIIGSPTPQTTNEKLLAFIKSHFSDEIDLELISVRKWPMFNKPKNGSLPSVVSETAEKIEAADGVLISTAEYDHSVPAILSNALAWLSYTIYPFVEKPTLMLGTSYGRLGSSRAQFHLRQMLNAPQIAAQVMTGDGFLLSHALQAFDNGGQLTDEVVLADLEAYIARFIAYIDANERTAAEIEIAKDHARAYDKRFIRK